MTPSVPRDADAPRGVGIADPDTRVRSELQRRTREILERERPGADPEAIERERTVVRECRHLMRLLATRARSEGELRSKLAERVVPAALAQEVMDRLERADLLDDAAFAAEWVRQRRELRGLGDEALRRELVAKQVAEVHIDAALAAGGDSEEQRCRELVRSRLDTQDRRRLRRERDGAHRRRLARRLDALLTRKGYPGDMAVHVIAGELRRAADRS